MDRADGRAKSYSPRVTPPFNIASSSLEFEFRSIGGVGLQCAIAGPVEGPVVLLLHGFPEFWYGWRHQLPALAGAGYRAVAPDLRGYNESSKPPSVCDYSMDALVDDVAALIRQLSPNEPIALAGHDWGGIIAWYAAMRHPELIRRLIILNAPHPLAYRRELLRPPWRSSQWHRSWYVLLFQLPWIAEAALRWNDFFIARRFFAEGPARHASNVKAEVARYTDSISRPRALNSMINFYRAALRTDLVRPKTATRRIETPTLLIWGDRDAYLVKSLAEGLEPWVTNLRVHHLPDATHWVQHDFPNEVNQLMICFLKS